MHIHTYIYICCRHIYFCTYTCLNLIYIYIYVHLYAGTYIHIYSDGHPLRTYFSPKKIALRTWQEINT